MWKPFQILIHVKNVCTKGNVYGKHDMWLAIELITYKYENRNANLDKNLH